MGSTQGWICQGRDADRVLTTAAAGAVERAVAAARQERQPQRCPASVPGTRVAAC